MSDTEYNTLTADEMALVRESLSPEESTALQRELYLRRRQKAWWLKGPRRMRNWFAGWIQRNRLDPFLDDLLKFTEEMGSHVSPYKVFLLYYHIRKLKPGVVVEYGAGSSTAFIAAMLELNARDFGVDGKVISFEQNPDWYSRETKYFPKALASRAEICLSPVGYLKSDGYRQIFYRDSPGVLPDPVDLIFIDGPAPVPVKGMSPEDVIIFSGDMVRFEKERSWRFAFTDIRYFNSLYFSKVLDHCRVTEQVLLRSIALTPTT